MTYARKLLLSAGFCALAAAGCSKGGDEADAPAPAPAAQTEASVEEGDAAANAVAAMFDPARADRIDKFSYANYDEVRVSKLALDLAVDFDAKILEGEAVLFLEYVDPEARQLILDTDDLEILSAAATTDSR